MESDLIFRRKVKNELRRIRQQIDYEKDRAKKAKMIKVYRKMSEALI